METLGFILLLVAVVFIGVKADKLEKRVLDLEERL